MVAPLDRKRLIAALVNVPLAHCPSLRVITLRVGQGDSLQEFREIPVRAGIEHQMPVIRHQAIRQKAHGHEGQTFFHDGEKIFLMRGTFENPRAKVRPVQGVVYHAADIHSPDSTHDGILPHHFPRKKVPDTFS